ncbi:uncharacterized protein JN550_011611 [Neoarthrinium moseri]|uniref:uncharacterized protein n=1 Tax=Neoarthrinium moseri TaxID=1658444 RepID=UPI001FDB3AC8|nr:uncharacterized protein JN550_011611 [Neoarthrinium moseri]KAI1860345.1 hypothetical protein JN550_011611 [Neoarthrinium moseri]
MVFFTPYPSYSLLVSSRIRVNRDSAARGRSAGVGVGGLSLGGGIPFVGTRYGWTSDTIVNYEIVVANGSVIKANGEENSDLAWALRGGSNNFGVVTRVDLQTFEQTPGYFYHPISTWEKAAENFVEITKADIYDEYAHMTLSWGYTAGVGTAVAHGLDYTKPGEENPSIFSEILSLPLLFGASGISNMTQKSLEVRAQQSANGLRYNWSTITLVSTEAMLNATYTRFKESLDEIQGLEDIVWSFTHEPLPPALYGRHAGSNPFGLGARNQTLVVELLVASWSQETDDQVVDSATRRLMSAIETDAQSLNAWDPFVYMNYAGPEQDPISSFGKQNVDRLRAIANRVDPDQVFLHQVPGGFQLK